ncbi:hypothetical protein WN944_026078 [Citrus x changshan-huyou]|uniref:Uncharacterized protein n=1 Tax=Citrus x changshan-huyou TaxID=2935761 RepID=A0AAP0QE78_9ROSI
MHCPVDVRFLFPPLMNLVVFFFFLKSQDGLAVLILLLFLLTAIRVPLSVSSPLSVSCGDHLPCLLAISTIASLILAPFLFLVVYLCLIILSLFYVMLISLLKRCCKRHTAVAPPPDDQVEVGVEGDQLIQDLQPSPTEDLV